MTPGPDLSETNANRRAAQIVVIAASGLSGPQKAAAIQAINAQYPPDDPDDIDDAVQFAEDTATADAIAQALEQNP